MAEEKKEEGRKEEDALICVLFDTSVTFILKFSKGARYMGRLQETDKANADGGADITH